MKSMTGKDYEIVVKTKEGEKLSLKEYAS